MRQLIIVALLLLTSAFTTLFAHASNNNYNKYLPERLIVVGDIHGDLDQAKAILRLANVIDGKGKWIGGETNAKLVQMGDLVDRGTQDREVLEFFKTIQKEARDDYIVRNSENDDEKKKALEASVDLNSIVTIMIGNHEIMNMMNDIRYVHPDSMAGFGGRDGHKKAWSKKGEFGEWIREHFKLVHTYNSTLFVHAGLASSFASYGVDKLNIAAKNAMAKDDFYNPIFGGDGPVWTRLLINRAEFGKCEMVESTLKKLNLERMVVGHTPQRDLRVKAFCDGKLIAVDVGISKYMYGGLAAVEISTDPQTGETIVEEIVPNDAEERSERELKKLEEQGGVDAEMLQEMLQTVNEVEKAESKKNKKVAGTEKKQKTSADDIAAKAAMAARGHKEKLRREREENSEL